MSPVPPLRPNSLTPLPTSRPDPPMRSYFLKVTSQYPVPEPSSRCQGAMPYPCSNFKTYMRARKAVPDKDFEITMDDTMTSWSDDEVTLTIGDFVLHD